MKYPRKCFVFCSFLFTFALLNTKKDMMKRIWMLLALAGMSAVGSAQDFEVTDPAEKHSVVTNSFWANWFVQGGASWNAFYGVGEKSLVAPFRKFPTGEGHTGLGLSLGVGKWFTPGLGLRAKWNGWQMGSEKDGVKADKYWMLNGQVLFNLSNMLLGYNDQRLWNVIPYLGAGINSNRSEDLCSTQWSLGLLNSFRLSDRLAANLELGWNSWEGSNSGLALKQRHQQFTLEVGLTYRLGNHKWRRSSDNDAKNALTEGELDALNAQLADAQTEIAALETELEEARKATPQPTAAPATAATQTAPAETKVVAAPVSIFFDLGKAMVVTPRDRENVASLARTAVEHKLRVVITGYADSRTGTPEGNLRLSQQRAQAVADQLVGLGVERKQIEVKAAGGVDVLGTTENNRRVVVELK
jgi:outer membrane protein OmpA-like peptidoglycan-associated protein